MFSVLWGVESAVTNFAQAQRQDAAAFGRFFHAMLNAGVYLPPSAFETWFASAAFDDDEALTRLAAALPAAAAAAARPQEVQ